MFREIIFRKWDIVAIHSVFCIPFPKCWTLVIAFIGLLVTTNNITSFVAPLSVKGFLVYPVLKNYILQSPLPLMCRTNLWIESVSRLDGGWWMLSVSTISSDAGKYTVIIDGTNFMAASENYFGVWNTIWHNTTTIFGKITFLTVPPTSFVGTSSWCLLL